MAKYEVLRDNYGFQNRYWEKGEIVELDPKTNPHPKNFKPLSASEKKETGGLSSQEESGAVIDPNAVKKMGRKELIEVAKKQGIMNAHMVSTEKLRETLISMHIQ